MKYCKLPVFLLILAFMTFSCGHTKSDPVQTTKYTSKPSKHVPSRRPLAPTIVVDPGHGAYDLGAHTAHYEEKDLCLKTGHFLRRHLERKGYHVIMTRQRDEYIPLKNRANMANQSKSQLLVSLHFNSAQNADAKGIEIFYYAKGEPWRANNSKKLAQTVLNKMLVLTESISRGVKGGNFCVIRETKIPAILVEAGFLTNKDELRKILDDRYLDKVAGSIADGIEQYLKECLATS